MTGHLDHVITAALTDFTEDVFARGWVGREYEAVSYFALGHLQRYCQTATVFSGATQISLETCVPGVRARNPKGRVNKDLVIWPAPGMTLWDSEWKEVNVPLAVLEWKVYRPKRGKAQMFQYDIDWLTDFSREYPAAVGYAVSLDLSHRHYRLCASRMQNGELEREWLKL